MKCGMCGRTLRREGMKVIGIVGGDKMTDSSKGSDSNTVVVGGEFTPPPKVEKIEPSEVYAKKAIVTVNWKSKNKTESFEHLVRSDGSVTIDFPSELKTGDTIEIAFT